MRIYFIVFFILISGCDGGSDPAPVTESVPKCTPYFIADFNNIVRRDRLKVGYSSELSGLCTSFEARYKALQRCGAYHEDSSALEIVNTDTVAALCGRNEKLGAALQSEPNLLSADPKPREQIVKFMVLDPIPFFEVRQSTRDFMKRKVFSDGNIVLLTAVDKKNTHCMFSSSAPLQNNDIVQVTAIEDATKNKERTLTYAAEVYRSPTNVSIVCSGVSAKEDPASVIKKQFGSMILAE